MESLELEWEIDPDEEKEKEMLVHRDLRQRSCLSSVRSHFDTTHYDNGRRTARRGLMTITCLATFMMFGALVVRFSSSSSPSQQTFNSRGLIQIHAGFDGSEALGAERSHVQFKDIDGTPKDPLEIFKDHGYTYSRLRVMVEPNGSYGLFQDIDYVKEMAREIVHTNSMKLLLDFHYSHWWADPKSVDTFGLEKCQRRQQRV